MFYRVGVEGKYLEVFHLGEFEDLAHVRNPVSMEIE